MRYRTLILVILPCFSPLQVMAAEISVPVTVTIVQCGSKENIEQSCQQDKRCCVFIDASLHQKKNIPQSFRKENSPHDRSDMEDQGDSDH